MESLPRPLRELMELLRELPGLGEKSSRGLALAMLERDPAYLSRLAEAIRTLPQRVGRCRECGALAEGELCPVCADPSRDRSLICVVEHPLDVVMMERTGVYRGLYHVLGGAISPREGVMPEDLSIERLKERIAGGGVAEVIVATDFDLPGNTTALYLAEELAPLGVKVTRPARGLPAGATLEYVDEQTLEEALLRRQSMQGEEGEKPPGEEPKP